MKYTLDGDVFEKLGLHAAVVVEQIYERQPHYNKAKLNIQYLTSACKMSRRTVHRVIKKLIAEGYFERHTKAEYSFTIKFFETFRDYPVYDITTI